MAATPFRTLFDNGAEVRNTRQGYRGSSLIPDQFGSTKKGGAL